MSKSLLLVILLATCFGGYSSAQAQVRAESKKTGEAMFTLPWGSGEGAVSRRDANESDPEGPAAFAVGPHGRFFVLDQVAKRVVVLEADGSFVQEIALPGPGFMDLEVTPDGGLVLLDRLITETVVVVDPAGGEFKSYGIAGPWIEHPGLVTALLLDASGVWLEYEHRFSVRILDQAVLPVTRHRISGRPGQDGKSLVASRTQRGVRLDVLKADGAIETGHLFSHHLPLERIVWLEESAEGGIWLVYHVVRWDATRTYALEEFLVGEQIVGAKSARRFTAPYRPSDWYQHRELGLMPDGSMVQMILDADGAAFVRLGGVR